MTKDELFEKFEMLFPDWAKSATSYKKIGSKCLVINFGSACSCCGEFSRVFLFIDYHNWQFGTKLYRKRPDIKCIEKEDEEKLDSFFIHSSKLKEAKEDEE